MKGLTLLIFCLLLQIAGWTNCTFSKIPTLPGTYQATNSCVDGAWTHYFHETGTEDLILFSVKTSTAATFDISTIKVVIPSIGVTRLSNAPYVVAGAPWIVSNKYWEAKPNESMPLANNISIRVYIDESDYNQIATNINSNFNGQIQTIDDLIFFGFKSGYNINPDPTVPDAHNNANHDNFVQCSSTSGVFQGTIYFAEMMMNDFIGGGLGGSTFGGVLPIELADFNLEEEDKKVKLTWTTLSEVENDYFSVMHSISGREFQDISRTKGAGNSSTAKNYTHFHKTPAIGDNYYRLKQVDYDGIESISEIKVIKFRGTKYIDITPTLAINQIRIDIPYQFDFGASLKIFDAHGRMVYKGSFLPEEQRQTVDVGSFAPGLYQIKVSDGDIFLSKAFMKAGK